MTIRGPSLARADADGRVCGRMMNAVQWGALDVLIVDLPPGTGECRWTLGAKGPLDACDIVSTPAGCSAAGMPARDGHVQPAQDSDASGMIENMSTHICFQLAGHEEHCPLGMRCRPSEARKLGVPLLQRYRCIWTIRVAADGGAPIVVSTDSTPGRKLPQGSPKR